ncbi:MAG: FtsX-like permease family protein [Candidatus Neomarinimicrobiota bacterium]|nr:FtsX-like permease family protein [Candidatus Neomarinimicrobiota bacterium]|tara:strand:+ start:2073 stop:3236 length:1164 start_codon:yes stop_codon:yes gene_type:complete
MSIFILSWKFFTRKYESNKINISSFLPIIGLFFGVFTTILTFAVMDGLEKDIFGTLENFSGGTTLNVNKVSSTDLAYIENYLNEASLKYVKFIDRKAIINFGEINKIINVRGFSDLNFIFEKFNVENSFEEINDNSIIIGKGLASNLNVSEKEFVKIFSPLDLKLSSPKVPQKSFEVSSLYATNLLDFDLNYVFIPYNAGMDLFKKSGNYGYFFRKEVIFPEKITQINNLRVYNWHDTHKNLVSAMKTEKIAYISFGFLLIIISCFSLLSTMSITVIQKIAQIGILKTQGYSNFLIIKIFLIFSLISGLLGVIFGILGVYLIKIIENKYSFIKLIFGNYPYLEFPILLDSKKIIYISSIAIILIVLSSIYPAIKASKLRPIKSIYSK